MLNEWLSVSLKIATAAGANTATCSNILKRLTIMQHKSQDYICKTRILYARHFTVLRANFRARRQGFSFPSVMVMHVYSLHVFSCEQYNSKDVQ